MEALIILIYFALTFVLSILCKLIHLTHTGI